MTQGSLRSPWAIQFQGLAARIKVGLLSFWPDSLLIGVSNILIDPTLNLELSI